MLIMGFGPRKPHDRGAVAPALCPNCGNHVTFRLLEVRNWFSLFFVPLVPGRARHAVVCPVCQYGIVVEGDPLDQARRLIDMTAAQQQGTGDPVAYRTAVDRFWRAVGGERLADQGDARPAPPEQPVDPAAATSRTASPQPDASPPPPPTPDQAVPDPPAGWYADPFGESAQRYWDGERWTAGTNPPVFER